MSLIKSKILIFIRYCILRTLFIPFNLFYKAVYDICLSIILFSLKGNKQVKSVYLIRGLAKNECIYGLSDIDLMIIVHPGSDLDNCVKDIKKMLSQIGFFFPGILPPLNEIGILTKDNLYKYSSDLYGYAFRMAEGVKTWKLLYGEDILVDLKRGDRLEDMPQSIIMELNLWWSYFINSRVDPENPAPKFLRNYLAFKSVAEICRIYLLACKQVMTTSRMEALEMMGTLSQFPAWGRIQNGLLKSYHKNFLGEELETELYSIFIKDISVEIFEKINDLPINKDLKRVQFNRSIVLNDILPEKYSLQIRRDIEDFYKKFADHITNVSLVPQVEFTYNHIELDDYYNRLKFKQAWKPQKVISNLDRAELFPVYLVIHATEELPGKVMDELSGLINKLRLFLEIYPYHLRGKIAFPLIKNYKKDIKQIKIPSLDPTFFYFLSEKALQICGSLVDFRADLVISPLIEQGIERNAEFLDPEFKDTHLVKTCTPGFLRFFLNAARTKIFLKSYRKDEALICVTPEDTFNRLYQDYPQHRAWLQRFSIQFKRSIQELGSDSPLFFTKVLKLFNNESQVNEPNPDQSVSVIIITANRRIDLAECLDSLVLQTRKPDEVIIIDNGHWQLVNDIIHLYKDTLNIRYIRELTQGIPMARNAGLNCANGDILVFIDDDCIADSQWLEKLVDPFLEDSSIGIVGGYLSGVGRTNKIVEKYYDFILQTKFELS